MTSCVCMAVQTPNNNLQHITQSIWQQVHKFTKPDGQHAASELNSAGVWAELSVSAVSKRSITIDGSLNGCLTGHAIYVERFIDHSPCLYSSSGKSQILQWCELGRLSAAGESECSRATHPTTKLSDSLWASCWPVARPQSPGARAARASPASGS